MPSTLCPIVVFDLDGTLADTAHDLVATLNVILTREGLRPLPVENARDMIGTGARALLQQGFAQEGRELTPTRLEELFPQFIAHYAKNLCVETHLFPGVTEALDRLEEDGFALAVCTNKMEAQSVALLEALGIANRFAAICGRDTFPFFKPDRRHLTLTIERAAGDPHRAVMVGDSRTDIATAKAAEVPVIGVPFGYTDTPVHELDPDAIADHFDEIPVLVQKLLAAKWERSRSASRG